MTFLQHVINHALQAHFLAVLRGINVRHPVVVQFTGLFRHDHPAATGEYPDVCATAFSQHVHHVLEEFNMPSLIGTQGDCVGIFLQRRLNDLFH